MNNHCEKSARNAFDKEITTIAFIYEIKDKEQMRAEDMTINRNTIDK